MPEAIFGGIPAWLLADYLVELGGVRDGDGLVHGDGWRATLMAASADRLAIARITVSIDGPRAAAVLEQLRVKARRGGG